MMETRRASYNTVYSHVVRVEGKVVQVTERDPGLEPKCVYGLDKIMKTSNNK